MEKKILERSFTQEVYVVEVDNTDHFPRYKMHFALSNSCLIRCWLDFGTDKTLRIYDIEGRQQPDSLAQFAEFVSHSEWLQDLIERAMRFVV